jgi:hypothetical protein
VACATDTSCLAVGTTSTSVSGIVPARGALLQSSDGGHTWTRSIATPSIDDIYGVDCPSARTCTIVGTDWIGQPAIGTGAVAQSRNGGASFTASRTEYTPLALTALACPTSRTSRTSQTSTPSASSPLPSAATSPVGCVAVGGDTVARITLPVARRAAPTPRVGQRTFHPDGLR